MQHFDAKVAYCQNRAQDGSSILAKIQNLLPLCVCFDAELIVVRADLFLFIHADCLFLAFYHSLQALEHFWTFWAALSLGKIGPNILTFFLYDL